MVSSPITNPVQSSICGLNRYGNTLPGGAIFATHADGIDVIGKSITLADSSGNGNDMVIIGLAGAWNRSAYAVINTSISLPADFQIFIRDFKITDLTVAMTFIGGNWSAEGMLSVVTNGKFTLYLANSTYTFDTVVLTAGVAYASLSVQRVGSNVTVTLTTAAGVVVTETKAANTSAFVVRYFGAHFTTGFFYKFAGVIGSVDIYNAAGSHISNWVLQSGNTKTQTVFFDRITGDHAVLESATTPFFTTEMVGSNIVVDQSVITNLLPYSNDYSKWAWTNVSGTGTVSGKTITCNGVGDYYRSKPFTPTVLNHKYLCAADVTANTARDTLVGMMVHDGVTNHYYHAPVTNGVKRRVHHVINMDNAAPSGVYPDIMIGGIGGLTATPNPTVRVTVDKFSAQEYVSSYPAISKIVCLGDSLTEREGFTEYLATLLDSTTIINAGVAGDTLAQMDARIDALLATHSPEYVIVFGGVNSVSAGVSLESMQASMTSILTKISNSGAQSVIIGKTPAGAEATWTPEKQQKLEDYMAWEAVQPCHSYIPLYNIFAEYGTDNLQVGITSDGLHPGGWTLQLIGEQAALALGLVYQTDCVSGSVGGTTLLPAYTGARVKLAGDNYLVKFADNAAIEAVVPGAFSGGNPVGLTWTQVEALADDTYLFREDYGCVVYSDDKSGRTNVINRILSR